METRHFRYKNLASDLEGQIKRGSLRTGERLPSLRNLHYKLGLSLNTIYQAYMELEALGLIEAQPKSGFFVKDAGWMNIEAPRFNQRPAAPAMVRLSDITNTVVANSINPDLVPLGASTLSTELMPQKQLVQVIKGMAPAKMIRLLQYEVAEGAVGLRRQLASRLLGLIPEISENDIIITNGCSEAVALALLATTTSGDVVAVESPTHFGFLQMLRELGLQVLELPTDPRHGVVLEGLSQALQKTKVKACLLMPNFQNPTGALMPEDHRQEVVSLLNEKEIPLIEDDIYGEMHFGKSRPGFLRTWDRKELVISCSSFSKTLAPGFRVGWLVAGRKISERIKRLKAGLSLASPSLQQHALARFLADGSMDRYLRLLRAAVHNQVVKTARAVKDYFPPECRFSVPMGGIMLWIELPKWADGIRLYEQALKAGISIIPGAAFSPADHYRNYIRISCTSPFSERIEKAIETLGELIGKQNKI
ncbi:MAG: PLP-dependent aminotransferase family protein [Deltaproteobacteria bacterium]|nr:PLP-dependent aminotransferase family protein [Deltaproteobacteria bacterium]